MFEYHITLLLWSNGYIAIPLALRVYQKSDTKKDQVTAVDLAMELLKYAKNTLQLRPEYVLMDGFYTADKMLKLLHEVDLSTLNWLIFISL